MCLLQAVLPTLSRRPLSIEQCERDVAVGVLISQRGQGWQGPSWGNVKLVAAVVVFLPHGGVVGVVERRAQLRVGGGHGCGCGRCHGDGGDGLKLSKGALLTHVQRWLMAQHGLCTSEGHFVLQLLPELGVELVALGTVPLDDSEGFDGVFERFHLLIVHDASQLCTLNQDDLDLSGH